MKAIKQMSQAWPEMRLLLCAVLSFSFSALSQGWVEFANSASGELDAPIYDVDGVTPLAGPAFLAQLYAAPLGHTLEPLAESITPFATQDYAAGYFMAVSLIVPGVPVGSMAAVQVVAWRASDGPTFAAANHPGAHIGESAIFDVGPLTSMGPPPDPLPAFLVGLQSFSLQVVVPEPSVCALLLLGGAALVLGRRRGRFRSRAARPPVPP